MKLTYRFRHLVARRLALLLAVLMLTETAMPTVAYALTGGPSQPEAHGFQPSGTTDMVDMFTGDFSYNIPLLDVGGYPINLAYRAGSSMDEEASWVGLGWSLNPGAINRDMRGLPDDFKGDEVKKEFNVKDDVTTSFQTTLPIQIFGKKTDALNKIKKRIRRGSEKLSVKIGGTYNSYTGFSLNYGLGINFGKVGRISGGVSLDYGASSGIDVSPNIGMSGKTGDFDNSLSFSVGFNSRRGLKDLSLGLSRIRKDQPSTIGTTGSYDFAASTYPPAPEMPLTSVSRNFHATIGGELFGIHPNVQVSGSYARQSLEKKNASARAYGTMHHDIAQGNPDNLMDFNKERPITYKRNQPKLPLSYGTYDLFSAAGQGLSGQFRIMRNDVGTLRDVRKKMNSSAVTAGLELGFGAGAHQGADIKTTPSEQWSGDWEDGKGMSKNLKYTGGGATSPAYEAAFFKNTGEPASEQANEGLRSQFGDFLPVASRLEPSKDGTKEKDYMYNAAASATNVQRRTRQKRNQVMSYLTAAEATNAGLDKMIASYPENVDAVAPVLQPQGIQKIARTTHPAHHISEMTVTQGDGARYVYGIPAYNNKQRECSFAVPRQQPSPDGLVSYSTTDASVDNNVSNSDKFFDSQELPAYAHSYLLTAVLSPDYVDVGNNGISDDDVGTAVKLNYTRTHSNYKWRTPFGLLKARHQEGNKADKRDDKGHYVYGEKEIWYVHSIETKTMVAQFIMEDRNDAIGVLSEHGGGYEGGEKLKFLRKIKLYSKADLTTPIKTVHFHYDYSLCKGIENNYTDRGGKLTLKKVWFTYGNNTSGVQNKYSFEYHNENEEGMYSLENYDRWGNFKNRTVNPGGASNTDFPYVLQQGQNVVDAATKTANAWNLKKVGLPSGGTIKVEYESDDYAYVQDKRAAQMMNIRGFTDATLSPAGQPVFRRTAAQLYENDAPVPLDYLVVDIAERCPQGVNQKQWFKEKYLANIEKLYFKSLINLRKIDGTPQWENVSGYMDIDYSKSIYVENGAGVANSATVRIPIKTLNQSLGRIPKVHPMYRIALQKMRNELPFVFYPEQERPNEGNRDGSITRAALFQLIGVFSEFRRLISGVEGYGLTKGYCKDIDVSKSWVRLSNPNYKKYGGGHRVKRIELTNYWGGAANNPNDNEYGQEYEYTTTIKVKEGNSNVDKVISSGVATYEPSVGGEENPFRNPSAFYNDKFVGAPNNTYYIEEPVGESLFPSPTVGYGKVTVKNLTKRNQGITSTNISLKRTGTGHVVHEFYTAKDFPVKVNTTGKNPVESTPSNYFNEFFKFDRRDMIGASQGYSIELNDMHGKPKLEEVFNAEGTSISWTKYDYRQSGGVLNNDDIPLVSPNGVITNGAIGVDMDVWHHMQENNTLNEGLGGSANNDIVVLPFTVLPIPTIWPFFQKEKKQFRGSVTTKLIKRFGIIDKVTKMENGSTVSTNNLLWDAETGQVLVTETQNEYNDAIYQTTIPAHWAYENGMGMAYKNIGLRIENLSVSIANDLGGAVADNYVGYFVPGDELLIRRKADADTQLGNIIQTPDGKKRIIKLGGQYLENGDYEVKVLRSGRRNQHSAAVGTIVSKTKPISGEPARLNIYNPGQVINAQASTFKDDWAVRTAYVENCDPVSFHNEANTMLNSNINPNVFASFLKKIVVEKSNEQPIEATTINNLLDAGSESMLMGIANTQMRFVELITTPIANASEVGSPTYRLYEAKLGDNCYLRLMPEEGETRFSFGCADAADITVTPPTSAPWNEWHITGSCKNSTDPKLPRIEMRIKVRLDCQTCTRVCHPALASGQVVNPYRIGAKGNWRPDAAYALYGKRSASQNIAFRNIRTEGAVPNFANFWNYGVAGNPLAATTSSQWVKTNTITYYDQKGNEVENKDALNIYSSALYRYKNTLASAVSANARMRETAFDGFEDYSFMGNNNDTCYMRHFDFASSTNPQNPAWRGNVSNIKAHTGVYSFKMASNSANPLVQTIPTIGATADESETNSIQNGNKIKHVIPIFQPGKINGVGRYVISFWVSKLGDCQVGSLENVTLNINGGTDIKPTGSMIEGWQRVEAVFDISAGQSNLVLQLKNATGDDIFIDDVRILPFNAKMKSFVYNASSLRLMAQLDENNYATFYEYDDEGSLVRTKRETEKGVVTVQENRNYIRPSGGN
jgi:hypothetical protein